MIFRSWDEAALIMGPLPFSLTGGFWLLHLKHVLDRHGAVRRGRRRGGRTRGRAERERPKAMNVTVIPAGGGSQMPAMNGAVAGMDGTMSMNGMAANAMVSGMGTITALDPKDGTIRIKQGPIPAMHWPAMTMMFQAAPKILANLGRGEEIAFDFQPHDHGGEVEAIRKP